MGWSRAISPSSWAALVAVLVAAWLVPGVAWADPDRNPPSGDDKVTSREYRQALDRGHDLFKRKKWQVARKHYQKAYEISPQPIILFNIGSTYRREGNHIDALFYYHRYLEEAPKDAPYRSFTETAIVDLEAKIAKAKADTRAKSPAKSKTDETPLPATRPPQPVKDEPNRVLQATGIILAVAGLGGLGWAGYQASEARNAADQLNDSSDGTPWSSELQDTFDRGESAETQAKVFAAAGGAAIVVGTVLFIVGKADSNDGDSDKNSISWTPVATGDSLGVVVRAAF